MRSAQAKITIHQPPATVHEHLLDIAAHAEFAPQVFREMRLTRIESYGRGAGARFRLHRKLRDRRADLTITEVEHGVRQLEEGSTGRSNRVPLAAEFRFDEIADGVTRVTWTIETDPGNPLDRLREFGMRRQLRRHMRSSLKRLRAILEDSPDAATEPRPTVNGMSPLHVPNP